MTRMSTRPLAVTVVFVALLGVLAVAIPLRRQREVAPPTPPEATVLQAAPAVAPPDPQPPATRVQTVELERGDTFVRALARGGIGLAFDPEVALLPKTEKHRTVGGRERSRQ